MFSKLKKIFGKVDNSPQYDDPARQRETDFINSYQTTFYETLSDGADFSVEFQDAIEVYDVIFEGWPNLKAFQALTDDDILLFTKTANEYFETEKISEQQIREIVKTSIWHWSEEDKS